MSITLRTISDSRGTTKGSNLTAQEVDQNFEDLLDNGVRTYDNIAALKATDPSDWADDTVVFVKGYYSSGDGGGGLFYWDSSSSATANDGTIIQSTGVSTGRWFRPESYGLNVKGFGAKGDGVNDDYSAIQNCITYAEDNDLGNIYLPNGTYNITDTLTINGSNYLVFNGSHFSKTIISGSLGSGNALMELLDADAVVRINGIQFKGNDSTQYGITVVQSRFGFTVDFCYFNGFVSSGNGVAIATSGGTSGNSAGSQDVRITNSHLWNNDNGIRLSRTFNTHIKRCFFRENTGRDIWVSTTSWNGITLADGDGLRIMGNVFWVFTDGLKTQPYIELENTGYCNQITANVFEDTGSTDPPDFIKYSNSVFADRIDGNYFIASQSTGNSGHFINFTTNTNKGVSIQANRFSQPNNDSQEPINIDGVFEGLTAWGNYQNNSSTNFIANTVAILGFSGLISRDQGLVGTINANGTYTSTLI